MVNGMIMGDCLQNDSFQFGEQIAKVLLIGSFPLKLFAESIVIDICRLIGFILIFVVAALRTSQKDKSAKADDKGV